LHRFPHWSASECNKAFGWDLEQWIYFGGYRGAASFITNETAWKRYINDALIETVVARDVLQLQTATKPALLRQLFALAATAKQKPRASRVKSNDREKHIHKQKHRRRNTSCEWVLNLKANADGAEHQYSETGRA